MSCRCSRRVRYGNQRARPTPRRSADGADPWHKCDGGRVFTSAGNRKFTQNGG